MNKLFNEVVDDEVYKDLLEKMSEKERSETEKFLSEFLHPFSLVANALEQCENDPKLMEELRNQFANKDA